jgi:hypothetical protein
MRLAPNSKKWETEVTAFQQAKKLEAKTLVYLK